MSIASTINPNISNTTLPKTQAAPATSTVQSAQADADEETVVVSTRAQNIQKLNEEFFASGVKEFTVTATFIQRLQEYNLISTSEASALTNNTATSTSNSENEALDTLTNKTTSLIDQLGDEDDDLSQSLTNALEILSRIDSLFDKPSVTEINEINNEITYFKSSEVTDELSPAQTKTLNELSLTLSVIEKLSPNTLNSNVVNQYLENLG